MKAKIMIAGLVFCMAGICSVTAQTVTTTDQPVSTDQVITKKQTDKTVENTENSSDQTLTGNTTLEVTNREERSKSGNEQPAEVPATLQRNKPE